MAGSGGRGGGGVGAVTGVFGYMIGKNDMGMFYLRITLLIFTVVWLFVAIIVDYLAPIVPEARRL